MKNENTINRIFIAGTDTGVGKTVLSLLVMKYFFKIGKNPFYLKPFQTGCENANDINSDANFIYRHINELKKSDPENSVIYCHKNPKAPLFAARDDNEKIELAKVIKFIEAAQKNYSHIIIEAAGGLLVPVTENFLVIDVIKELKANPIIAARAGLGTINHTLLSLEALAKRSIDLLGIILIDPGPDITPARIINENMEAIEKFSGYKVSGIIKRIENFYAPGKKCFLPIAGIFNTGKII